MGRTIYKCPFCDNKYVAETKEKQRSAKNALYRHMENKHKELLGDLSPAQVYFNFRYNKTHGSCVICGKETKWNEATERYERFCSEKCKQAYRKEFQRRMKAAGKENQMNDPEFQKKMLANRKISGDYLWSDKKTKTHYVGSYERDFLEFLDLVMQMNPTDVMGPAPQIFKYKYEGKEHFYIPDFYITSLNLLIEIKDGGDNPNNHPKIKAVDKEKEKLKDKEVLRHKEYNYVKVVNKDYSIFLNYLLDLKDKENEK
jgi:endogenous inhibitor of DNA gyrase (YacG/DUF329 family)